MANPAYRVVRLDHRDAAKPTPGQAEVLALLAEGAFVRDTCRELYL